eukprot:scaffold20264_cov65-Phaeocystis_antarctica.AAC.4
MAENLVAASGAKHTLPRIGWVAVEEPMTRTTDMGAANSAGRQTDRQRHRQTDNLVERHTASS